MKTRGLIALAVVAAALAGVLIRDAFHRSPGGDHAAARARLLPPFDRSAVRRIVVRPARDAAFTLVRAPSPAAAGSSWRIDTADGPAADDAAIADLLSAADLAESDRRADISPEAAGLRPPAVEIDIETPAGVLSAQLGRFDAAGRGVYARAGEKGPIRVVSRRLFDLAARPRDAFRDRRVFPLDPASVTAIEWRDKAGAHELRVVDGRWQNGRKEPVDEGRVTEALRRLFGLRIEEFNHENVAGTRTLAVTAGGTRLSFGGGEQGTLKRDDQPGLRVPADALVAVWSALAAAEVRDLRLVSMPADEVKSVDLSDGTRRVSLRRVNGAWTFVEPKVRYAADTGVVDDWLARLATITTPTRAAGPHPRRLVVEGRFRQEAAVSSPADVYDLLAPDPLRFRERALLSFARFDVRRLQRTVGKDVQIVTSDDGGSWQGMSGANPNAANVARVVGALSDLRAEEFLAQLPQGEPSARLEIDVQQPGDARPTDHVVRLYPACVAHLDADATFTIERAACDALGLPLLQAR